jgi:hypothetical protein
MLCVVPQAPAQPARDGATLEVLMGEVRALRMAIERQTALAARGQLLMGRLTLQEQRLLRARLELQSTEREIASAASELAQARAEQENAQLALENAEPAQRSHVEIGLRLVASRLRELQERATALEVRRSQATQALESERGRQEELERWVEQLERELIRNTP